VRSLESKGVSCAPRDRTMGHPDVVPLPSGADVGLYQPTHPTGSGSLDPAYTGGRLINTARE
jgi:hypothetical protein